MKCSIKTTRQSGEQFDTSVIVTSSAEPAGDAPAPAMAIRPDNDIHGYRKSNATTITTETVGTHTVEKGSAVGTKLVAKAAIYEASVPLALEGSRR